MKKILLTILFMSLMSCASQDNVLYVGTNAEFPPFEYKEKDQIVGFDIDLIHEVAKEMNVSVQISDMTWDGLLPALQGGKVDVVIAGMSKTPDREKIVNFSEPYYQSPEQMIIVSATNESITNMDSFTGKKIGVILGYTGDMVVTEMEGQVQIERYNSTYQAILDVVNEKLDALVLDYAPAQNYSKTVEGIKLITGNNTVEHYSIALRKDDTELLSKVNEALKKIVDSGKYNEIYQKYFPE